MNVRRLFVASCLSLLTTSMVFAIRGDIEADLSTAFHLTKEQIGLVWGPAFWGFTLAILASGAIVDDRHGGQALARLNARGAWIGRPVELPGSRPLEFETRGSIALDLLQWPRHHVVKCLVHYHPADPVALRLDQEDRLVELARVADALERELLIEVICSSTGRPVDARTTPAVMKRFYHLGIRPAWWKIEAQPAESWAAIAAAIAANDPLCRGVLLLGLDAPEEQVAQSFDVAARHPVCRGFAIGRTIFGAPARDWLAGKIAFVNMVRPDAGARGPGDASDRG